MRTRMTMTGLAALVLALALGGTVLAQGPAGRYNFDQVVKNVSDPSTNAQFVTSGDAQLGLYERPGKGLAMSFPAPGTAGGAILEVGGDEGYYDPVDREIAVTVEIRLTPDDLTSGMNVIQKGRFGPGQWKLQVDAVGTATLTPVPGCRFADADGDVAFPKATQAGINAAIAAGDLPSGFSLTDGEWHTINCRTFPDGAKISIDGAAIQHVTGVALGTIENDDAVSIGGVQNADGTINDQYTGDLDNITINFL